MQITTGAKNALLGSQGIKELFDGAFLWVFADPEGNGVPDVEAALPTSYTLLAKLSLDDPAEADGSEGVEFSAAGGGITFASGLQAILSFAGDDTSSPQAPTFARLSAESAANVRTASTSAARAQFTCGGPSTNSEITLNADTFTDSGTNSVSISYLQIIAG